ncbi:3-phosphoserine/phosphohydroxythreonine transaminase [Spirochaetia bacterium 38H-sp]|uniref:Phosphoserine aminotransferase n=1 Tax=Rarispira pelagica TaxID=3141764 RepID=A0ABU9U8T9_9SPIR
MERVYNFSAGPSALPEEVLKQAAEEMLNYQGSGMSVMEMSHRSPVYDKIIKETEENLRKLMNIPENYAVLFLQGGASLQFSMVPINLLTRDKKAAYIDTGVWSTKAIKEAQKIGETLILASSRDKKYSYIPEVQNIPQDIEYLHITTNNTIYGTRYTSLPKTDAAIVADASSNILSEPVDINKFGIYYAGAQKNLGPAGVTIVIIRKDLIGREPENTPTMLAYKTHAEKNSLFNTPPCYNIYMVGLVLKWLQKQGGVEAIYQRNLEKASIIYDFLDNSELFTTMAEKKDRSIMNVVFFLPTEELTKKFLDEAAKNGLVNLKGHRDIGGLRASIYNAMPVEGVKKLVEFMKKFEKENRR